MPYENLPFWGAQETMLFVLQRLTALYEKDQMLEDLQLLCGDMDGV